MKRLITILLILFSCTAFGQFHRHVPMTPISNATYATWNPSDKAASITLSNGNLTATTTSTNGIVRATIGISSASARNKVQWEVTYTNAGLYYPGVCALLSSTVNAGPGDVAGVGLLNQGNVYVNGSLITTTTPSSSTDVLDFALDMSTGNLYYYLNGTLITTLTTGLTGTQYPATGTFNSVGSTTVNFGATAFTYPIAGYTGVYN